MKSAKPSGVVVSQTEDDNSRNMTECISYGIGRCFIGWMIVALSGQGICAIELADSPEELPPLLLQRFSGAELRRADAELAELLQEVRLFIEEPDRKLPVPLDIRGTHFQQSVWERIRRIPPGETKSYSDIAAELGNPQAVRAVAGACAANRLAVAVPCHRVLAKDGRISGYHWGVTRKKQLLANEQKKTSRKQT